MPDFIWPIRVYYEDTDAGGVVYHSNYLNFLERARTEWLRHHGIEQDALRHDHGLLFVVRRLCVDYRKPAYFNQMLHIHARLLKLGRASLEMAQEIRHRDEILCSAQVKIACIDSRAPRPRALPKDLLALFTPLIEALC